jgi:hypothetical protein
MSCNLWEEISNVASNSLILEMICPFKLHLTMHALGHICPKSSNVEKITFKMTFFGNEKYYIIILFQPFATNQITCKL